MICSRSFTLLVRQPKNGISLVTSIAFPGAACTREVTPTLSALVGLQQRRSARQAPDAGCGTTKAHRTHREPAETTSALGAAQQRQRGPHGVGASTLLRPHLARRRRAPARPRPSTRDASAPERYKYFQRPGRAPQSFVVMCSSRRPPKRRSWTMATRASRMRARSRHPRVRAQTDPYLRQRTEGTDPGSDAGTFKIW